MFPKSNRFPAAKASDVPGPGAYDPQDPNYDAYKHGAFLEKQDRFVNKKPSEVPEHETHKVEPNGVKKLNAPGVRTNSDRSAVLQRKVDELERLYAEAKKSHQAEVERLKGELNRTQKASAEQNDRLDKLKKQNDALDSRLQELKKINLSDQSEIRELRTKLRVAEHERAQLASKQGEAGEVKKALQALDAKRRDEVRERDRKIAELEKTAAVERKRREGLESKLTEMKTGANIEVRQAQESKAALDAELRETKEEGARAKASLVAFETQARDREDELILQLEQHRLLLSRVAEEYGRLASTTVSRIEHDRVKSQSRILQFQFVRLERKLANSEGQVLELANLIRCTKDQNGSLAAQLQEAEAEASRYSSLMRDVLSERPAILETRELDEFVEDIRREIRESQLIAQQVIAADADAWANFERLRTEHLLLHSALLDKQLETAQEQVRQQCQELAEAQCHLSAREAELSTVRSEHQAVQTRLVETMSSLSVSQAREETLKKEIVSLQTHNKAETTRLEQRLREEKEVGQRLASVVQTSKAAEEALHDEVAQLTADLAEAEKYREAYDGLLEEVDALVERHALAEDEAQRLSKFNAEILGHHNPAQRIMYVDRIREELHDTKEQLLAVTRDRDALLNANDDLQYELELYTSVGIPLESKPKTNVTRVARIPFANQNVNMSGRSLLHAKSTSSSGGALAKKLDVTPELDYREGDMTIDELT